MDTNWNVASAHDALAPTLERDLASVLNRYSQENGSNTPDFILADYLLACLAAFNTASRARESWYGRSLSIGGSVGSGDETMLRQFVGFLSGDVPELHDVEIPRLAESVERFVRRLPAVAQDAAS